MLNLNSFERLAQNNNSTPDFEKKTEDKNIIC